MWWKPAYPIFWTRNIHNMAWFMFARHILQNEKNASHVKRMTTMSACVAIYVLLHIQRTTSLVRHLKCFSHFFIVISSSFSFFFLLRISYVMAQMQTAKSIFNLEMVSIHSLWFVIIVFSLIFASLVQFRASTWITILNNLLVGGFVFCDGQPWLNSFIGT